jgi:hypothetical protein
VTPIHGSDANGNPSWIRADIFYPYRTGTECRLAFALAQVLSAIRICPLPVVAIGDNLAVQSADSQRIYDLGPDDQPHLIAARLRGALAAEQEIVWQRENSWQDNYIQGDTEPALSEFKGKRCWIGRSGIAHTFQGQDNGFQSRFARLLATTLALPFPYWALWIKGEGGSYVAESKTDGRRYVLGNTADEIEVNLPAAIREDRQRNGQNINETWLAQAPDHRQVGNPRDAALNSPGLDT